MTSSVEHWSYELEHPLLPPDRVQTGGEAATAPQFEEENFRRSGSYLRWVQGSLNKIQGAGLGVDGIAGPRTTAAVRQFQSRRGLPIDGIVGPNTERALIAAGAPTPPGPISASPATTARPVASAAGGRQSTGQRYLVRHPTLPESKRRPVLVDIDLAAARNRRYAKSQGWGKHRKAVFQLLMDALKWPVITSEAALAMAVAQWQIRWDLSVDGQLGPRTWQRMRPSLCMGYESGEEAQSRSAAGHLERDVMLHRGGLLIADFPVGKSAIRDSVRKDRLLREWLVRWEANPAYRLVVLGFSDCVGAERSNEALRQARAAAAFALLGPNTRTRVDSVASARMPEPLVDGLSIRTRALNRSAWIQFKRDLGYKSDVIPGKPIPFPEIVANCRRVVRQQKQIGIDLGAEGTKRIMCWLDKILDPNTDDRYIPRVKWLTYSHELRKRVSDAYLEQRFMGRLRTDVRFLNPYKRDRYVLAGLQDADEQIGRAIAEARRSEYPGGGGSSVNAGDVQVHNWISKQARNDRSIYTCYR